MPLGANTVGMMPVMTNNREYRERLDSLVTDVDELLGYISIIKTPEVDAVRQKLEQSLHRARRELCPPKPFSDVSDARGEETGTRLGGASAVAVALGALLGVLVLAGRYHNRRWSSFLR